MKVTENYYKYGTRDGFLLERTLKGRDDGWCDDVRDRTLIDEEYSFMNDDTDFLVTFRWSGRNADWYGMLEFAREWRYREPLTEVTRREGAYVNIRHLQDLIKYYPGARGDVESIESCGRNVEIVITLW